MCCPRESSAVGGTAEATTVRFIVTVAPRVRPRVAIIGSGVAGLTAAWGLQHACDLVLYEGGERLGGHILPHDVEDPRGNPAAVDTAFVVFVPETYPRLTAMLDRLGVAHAPAVTRFFITDASRGLSFDAADLVRLCGTRLPAQCRRELLHVYQTLVRVRRDGHETIANVALADWLAEQGYHSDTIELGVLPWVASFWGLQPETVLTVSARVALREIARNAGPYRMHRVVPSTRGYLDRFVAALDRTEIRRVRVRAVTLASGPTVHAAASDDRFDRVILATDAIDARALLTDAPTAVGEALAAFAYEPTVAVVHRDARGLPRDRAQWRTFHHRRDRQRSSTTWIMDLLHEWHADPAEIGRPVLLSTGDPGLPAQLAKDEILAVYEHRHLVSTPHVVAAVAGLAALDRDQAFTLAGSYLRIGGLHEDALVSGACAADKVRRELGLQPAAWPWTPAKGA